MYIYDIICFIMTCDNIYDIIYDINYNITDISYDMVYYIIVLASFSHVNGIFQKYDIIYDIIMSPIIIYDIIIDLRTVLN